MSSSTSDAQANPKKEESKSSSGSSSYIGLQVDWELKLLAVATIFATIKLLTKTIGYDITALICRVIFILGHAFYFYIYLDTNHRISKSSSRSVDEKKKIKEVCFNIAKSLIAKGGIMAAVHWRTGILPPLVVTVVVGFFAFIENDFFYQVLYSHIPRLFELIYQ